jgi:hypothetical protein
VQIPDASAPALYDTVWPILNLCIARPHKGTQESYIASGSASTLGDLERPLAVPGGAYVVTKRLPERDGEFEYRIKSANEPHERVALESRLKTEL